MQPPYIPPKDSLFNDWLQNFAALITATPAIYGLVAGDALAIQNQADAFQAAYSTAVNPPTRTKPSVADKDAARAAALGVVRPYAINIRNNAGVSNMDKEDLGLNIPDFTPTPIPAPVTNPVMTILNAQSLQQSIRYVDSVSPSTRGKKPAGVIGVELFVAVGVAAAIDPAQASYYNTLTKNPNVVNYDSSQRGKVATMFARYVTRSGPLGVAQKGPWSEPVSMIIV